MDRQQFAETVANAYVEQFSTDGSPVMNECVITFNGENFGSQSSLTPVDSDETVVMSLQDGMFGDVDADDPQAAEWITGYLVDSASDEGWQDVIAIIEQAAADKAAWDAE